MRALLIGIDFYLPGRLADGSQYPRLGGCVRDIHHVQTFLESQLRVPSERITRLTATSTAEPNQQEPPEPAVLWPTYNNMVRAFEQLTSTAEPGEAIYVHYSGHGGRTPTLVPEQKGAAGEDESLVPLDIHRPDARYLRDVELALVFKRMVDKGVSLTVVLDSCHSGGAARGAANVAVRGINVLDHTPRPADSLVAPPRELAANWSALTRGSTRNVTAGSGWLPEPQGYVLLAACRPSESAYEFAFDGQERNGALTYSLLDTLRVLGTGVSCTALHHRTLARVHGRFVEQTPQLQGDGNRTFLGTSHVVPQPSVPVLEVDTRGERLRLAAGQALGVGRGAQFAVYPFGTIDLRDRSSRQAVVTVTELGTTDAWANVTERASPTPIVPGAPAVLISPGSVRLSRSIGFLQLDHLPVGIDPRLVASAVEAVRLKLEGNQWVTEAGPDDAVELQVLVNDQSEYEIWDAAGARLPNLRPPLRIEAPDAAERLVQRLVHMTRYRAVEELENYDPMSTLAGKLVVELVGVQDHYVAGDRPNPVQSGQAGSTFELRVGQTAFARVRNASSRSLNIAILDLQPDWGISQIYPAGAEWGVELDPGRELPLIPLRASLPPGFAAGRDVVKFMAAIGPANFRLLELPQLDEARETTADVRGSATRGGLSQLETLMHLIAAERPHTRNMTSPANPSVQWTTATVEFQTRQAG